MHQYTRNFAVLLLALSSALLVTPSFAQTITESNKDNTSNIIPLQPISASDTTAQSKLSNSGSGDKKSVIVSEADNKASSRANVAALKRNPRIPIFSRVFAVPSMQQ